MGEFFNPLMPSHESIELHLRGARSTTTISTTTHPLAAVLLREAGERTEMIFDPALPPRSGRDISARSAGPRDHLRARAGGK